MRALLLGVAVLAGLACGPPRAGDPCRTSGGFRCENATTALECRAGSWAAMACRGPGGCTIAGAEVSCDLQGNVAGDLCPLAKENQGLCGPGGLSMLQCRAGVLVTTSVCARCAVVAGNVVCGT
jgi:hypothetical protein